MLLNLVLLQFPPQTQRPPLTQGASGIPIEAVNGSAEYMEDYVDQLKVIIVRLLPWLKGDISSSGSSNQRNHTPEPWNEEFEFQAPESEQLDEAETATQIRLDLKHLNEIIDSRFP